jgi:1,4-alpha-glucan branching enzyme
MRVRSSICRCVHRCGKVWAVNPREDGVAFRVWAPHADAVFVIGSFNDWPRTPPKDGGTWYADLLDAKPRQSS